MTWQAYAFSRGIDSKNHVVANKNSSQSLVIGHLDISTSFVCEVSQFVEIDHWALQRNQLTESSHDMITEITTKRSLKRA
jgi:hypothetical protein